MPLTIRLILVLLLALPAAGQYGPTNPQNPPAGQPGGPIGQPQAQAQAMAVPEYIKPGFQLTYMSSSSIEGKDANDTGSAGMGFTEYTVIAVTRDKVYVTAANYLAPNGVPLTPQGGFDPNPDPRAQLSGATSFFIGAMDVVGGNALWMPADQLAQMQSGNGVEVNRGPWPYDGKQVSAVTITVPGNDSMISNTFNADTGVKLISRSAVGPLRRGAGNNNPYNRQSQSLSQLLTTTQLDNPLIGAPWPDWAAKVKKMTYQGAMTQGVPGGQPVSLAMTTTVQVTERGEDYIVGTTTQQIQGVAPGQPSPFVQGPGSMLGYWVHPRVLGELRQGEVLHNPITRGVLTYQVQDGDLGRLGVFVQTNPAQTYYAVSGYNLQDGALVYLSYHLTELNMTIELRLQGIEQE